jgi:hypothetical protein
MQRQRRKVAMHQSQYLPWPPYFRKMAQADVFILMDSVQYQKNGVQNRNKIHSANGPLWLTIPIGGSLDQDICAKLPTNEQWRKKHIQSIRSSYARTRFFSVHFDAIATLIQSSGPDLHSINMALIRYFRSVLGITNELRLLSELAVHSNKNQLVLDSCNAVGADLYISGSGALDYMDRNSFQSAGIQLAVLQNDIPHYTQYHQPSVDGLSMLDWLMQDDIDVIRQYLNKPMELSYD